jgi:hypothetical protein
LTLSSWLSNKDAIWIVLILVAAMMLTAEAAFLAGLRRQSSAGAAEKEHVGAIRVPLVGLVSLLLGFSFAMAGQRHEARRQLVIEDAKQLRALYMWSNLLSKPQDEQFTRLLRQYVDIRADGRLIKKELSSEEVADVITRSDAVYREMWGLAKEMKRGNTPSMEVDEILRLLIDSANVHHARVQAYISRVPDVVLWLLFGTSLLGLAAFAFSGGLNGHRGMLVRFLIVGVIAGTVFVILEMDRPGRGPLKVDQGPLVELKRDMDRDAWMASGQREEFTGETAP